MISGSGALPEVSNAQSGSTVNWDGDVIRFVEGSSGNDTVTGTEGADDIFDYAGPDTDTGAGTDDISGAGGNDFLGVEDGDTSDSTVTWGPGDDTVFFDEGDTLLDEVNCEEQNPPEPELEDATTYRAQILEQVPDSVIGGDLP